MFHDWESDLIGAIPSCRYDYYEYVEKVVALAERPNAEKEIANYLYRQEIEDFKKEFIVYKISRRHL